LNVLDVDPKVAKLRSDKALPKLEPAKIDKSVPPKIRPYVDTDEPKRELDLTLRDDAQLTQFRIDKPDPRVVREYTEIAEPILALLLIDTVDPRCWVQNTDKCPPIRTHCRTLKVDPQTDLSRIENVSDPTVLAHIDIVDPNRAYALSDNALPRN
jgi:hypothetical protein